VILSKSYFQIKQPFGVTVFKLKLSCGKPYAIAFNPLYVDGFKFCALA
jgi:hypothetical protein